MRLGAAMCKYVPRGSRVHGVIEWWPADLAVPPGGDLLLTVEGDDGARFVCCGLASVYDDCPGRVVWWARLPDVPGGEGEMVDERVSVE